MHLSFGYLHPWQYPQEVKSIFSASRYVTHHGGPTRLWATWRLVLNWSYNLQLMKARGVRRMVSINVYFTKMAPISPYYIPIRFTIKVLQHFAHISLLWKSMTAQLEKIGPMLPGEKLLQGVIRKVAVLKYIYIYKTLTNRGFHLWMFSSGFSQMFSWRFSEISEFWWWSIGDVLKNLQCFLNSVLCDQLWSCKFPNIELYLEISSGRSLDTLGLLLCPCETKVMLEFPHYLVL